MKKIALVILAIVTASMAFYYFDSQEKVVEVPLNKADDTSEIKEITE